MFQNYCNTILTFIADFFARCRIDAEGLPRVPKTTATDTKWLERHGQKWRVTVAVPRDLHGILGTRLKCDLHTGDLTIANQTKSKVVEELRRKIGQARKGNIENSSVSIQEQDKSVEKGVMSFDSNRKGVDVKSHTDIDFDIISRVEETLRLNSSNGQAYEKAYVISIHEIKLEPSRKTYLALAREHATDMMFFHQMYLDKSLLKARTKADDIRAMHYLARWCESEGVPPTLQAISKRNAIRFMDQFGALCGGLTARTQNKYLGRLSRYWDFMLRREYIDKNPWQGVVVKVPTTKYDEEERSFTDIEVRTLLAGGAEPRLMDLMLIGALTGARLDAIVDLRIKDVTDGAFTFKPQKKERTARDVPIHAALASIVTRRTTGRLAEDPFFPEWPGPVKEASLRERSFKASNHFTKYRRACGVDETIMGKRRSLVNFHSFRRWFVTKAERAGNSGDLIAALVGHKRSGMTLGRYSEGPDWEAAQRCIASVELPILGDAPLIEARSLSPRHRGRRED